MTREQAHLQYVMIMAAANHYHRWKEEEAEFYREEGDFIVSDFDFGTYEDRLKKDLKTAREAIDKVEEKILASEGLINI